jgi:hypothetical protein
MNIELTKNNHFHWGYNNIPWSRRERLYDRFYSSYGKVDQSFIAKPTSLRDESIKTAKAIAEHCRKINKQPMIFYSGGLDSEVVIAAFLQSGENFSVGHLRYVPEFNYHDTMWVYRFCRANGLDLKEYEINPIEFLSSEAAFNTAVNDNARLMQMQLVTYLMDTVKDDYYPILGNGEPYLFRENPDPNAHSRWIFKELEYMMPWYNHAINNNIQSCPGFFQWSPEITLSFLLDPIMKDLVNNKFKGKVTSRSSKYSIYNSAFPEYELQPRKKYTGYEMLSREMINKLNKDLNYYTFYDKNSYQEYEYFEFLKQSGYNV